MQKHRETNSTNRRNTAKAMPFPIEPRALKIDAAAAALGVSRSGLYALIHAGKIRYVRITGGSMRIPVLAIEEFITKNSVGGAVK